MSERQKCDCCESELTFQWSDTHGVGVCISCGLPYRVYHYDENNNRVEKAPEMCLTSEGLQIAKRYWTEKQRRVFPAYFDMGIGRNGRSYSGASHSDCTAFSSWYEATYPQPEAQAS